jgi:hypothetical protein
MDARAELVPGRHRSMDASARRTVATARGTSV